jgi:hypothetical protein
VKKKLDLKVFSSKEIKLVSVRDISNSGCAIVEGAWGGKVGLPRTLRY